MYRISHGKFHFPFLMILIYLYWFDECFGHFLHLLMAAIWKSRRYYHGLKGKYHGIFGIFY